MHLLIQILENMLILVTGSNDREVVESTSFLCKWGSL